MNVLQNTKKIIKIQSIRSSLIKIYDTKQHHKPHVHVYYGDYEAAIGIDGELLAGLLPRKQ